MGASLEEVVGCLSGDVWFSATRGRIKLEEGVLQGIIQLHDGSLQSINKNQWEPVNEYSSYQCCGSGYRMPPRMQL